MGTWEWGYVNHCQNFHSVFWSTPYKGKIHLTTPKGSYLFKETMSIHLYKSIRGSSCFTLIRPLEEAVNRMRARAPPWLPPEVVLLF